MQRICNLTLGAVTFPSEALRGSLHMSLPTPCARLSSSQHRMITDHDATTGMRRSQTSGTCFHTELCPLRTQDSGLRTQESGSRRAGRDSDDSVCQWTRTQIHHIAEARLGGVQPISVLSTQLSALKSPRRPPPLVQPRSKFNCRNRLPASSRLPRQRSSSARITGSQ